MNKDSKPLTDDAPPHLNRAKIVELFTLMLYPNWPTKEEAERAWELAWAGLRQVFNDSIINFEADTETNERVEVSLLLTLMKGIDEKLRPEKTS